MMHWGVALVGGSVFAGLPFFLLGQSDSPVTSSMLVGATIVAALPYAILFGICLVRRQKRPLLTTSPWALAKGRRHPLYRLARVVLLALSIGLLATSVNGLARSFELMLHAGALQLPDSDQELEKTVMVQVAKATATLDFDSIILEALADEDIHRAEIYVSVARRIGFSLRPQTEKRFADATDTWSSAVRSIKSGAKGFASGSVEDVESFGGALLGDISGWGDVRDITVHGSAYLSGRPYDELILGLSVFGLGITFLEPSQTLNTGAAVLKGTNRLRRVSQPLQRQLRRMVGETVDMGAAKAMLRNPSAESAAKIIRRQNMGELQRAATHAGTIYGAGGSRALVMALRHADSVEELSLFARLARTMGKQADEVMEIAGKRLKVAFRAHKVTQRTAAMVTGWTTALVAAVLALATSLSAAAARRIGTHYLLARLAVTLARRQLAAPGDGNRYGGTPV